MTTCAYTLAECVVDGHLESMPYMSSMQGSHSPGSETAMACFTLSMTLTPVTDGARSHHACKFGRALVYSHDAMKGGLQPATMKHGSRLLSWSIGEMWTSVVQGYFWLQGRTSMCGSWSQAGAILRVGPGGPWFAAVPKDSWPEDEEACQDILKVSKRPQHFTTCYCPSACSCWQNATVSYCKDPRPYLLATSCKTFMCPLLFALMPGWMVSWPMSGMHRVLAGLSSASLQRAETGQAGRLPYNIAAMHLIGSMKIA